MLRVHVVSIHQAMHVSKSFQTIQEAEIQHVEMQHREELIGINSVNHQVLIDAV